MPNKNSHLKYLASINIISRPLSSLDTTAPRLIFVGVSLIGPHPQGSLGNLYVLDKFCVFPSIHTYISSSSSPPAPRHPAVRSASRIHPSRPPALPPLPGWIPFPFSKPPFLRSSAPPCGEKHGVALDPDLFLPSSLDRDEADSPLLLPGAKRTASPPRGLIDPSALPVGPMLRASSCR